MRKRPLANLNNHLLDRLVRTGLLNICFTERQKLSLLHVAGTITPSTQNLFHQTMLELNLIAVGMTSETPHTTVLPRVLKTDNRLQALIPILSELLPGGEVGNGTMRVTANAELALISRGMARLRAQGELMRTVGARMEESGGRVGIVGGRGMNILPHRFNPGVGLSQVFLVEEETDCSE
jgi:hypothetical protein